MVLEFFSCEVIQAGRVFLDHSTPQGWKERKNEVFREEGWGIRTSKTPTLRTHHPHSQTTGEGRVWRRICLCDSNYPIFPAPSSGHTCQHKLGQQRAAQIHTRLWPSPWKNHQTPSSNHLSSKRIPRQSPWPGEGGGFSLAVPTASPHHSTGMLEEQESCSASIS